MSRLALLTSFLVFLVTSLATAVLLAGPAPCVPGELLLILKDGSPSTLAAAGKVTAAEPRLVALLERHGLTVQEPLIHKVGPLRGRDTRYIKLLSAREDFDPIAAAGELTATGLFRAVSPNWRHQLFVLPNDSYLSSQWYIDSPGGGDISLPEAWDVEQGDAGTVIAIVDTGVDWSHPDLNANCWQNPGEIADNGLDDDGNGYVDDVHGWDCGNSDGDPRPDPYFELGIDVGFHGTHCAGIASATTNNGTGVAGAGWNCRIMGLKLTGAGGSFTTAAVTAAFLYAIDEGADVISMSFGGTYQDFGFMQSLVDDATVAGIVCVAACGNNNTSEVMYPAGLDNVLSVAATNESNQRASFSTYGAWVDVAAPGEHIWSTICQNYEFDFMTALLFMLSYGWDGINPYMYSDGTSMACPLVAGVCALVRSAAPSFTAEEVAQRIIDTGDIVAYDQPIGVKVNAFTAVDGLGLSAINEVPGSGLALGAFPNPFNPRTNLHFVLPAAGQVRLDIYDVSGRLVRSLLHGTVPAGPRSVVWAGDDATGRRVASGVYFAQLLTMHGERTTRLSLLK